MNAVIYVNTPLSPDEHAVLETLAKSERRSKGQQLRLLALKSLSPRTTKPKRKGVTK
jgi:hypothetical protein